MFRASTRFSALVALATSLAKVQAFDNSARDNLAVYWGQNSYGAANSNTAYFQQPIDFYCQDDSIDAIPVAFVDTFFGTGNLPVMNLANTCNNVDNATFSGTDMPNCQALASNIEACQAKGKIVTISLGGAGGGVGFQSDDQAETFAQTIWDLYLGGSSSTRPFGDAVLDGVDLDIESGGGTGYAAFVTKIRSLASGASKQYYITGAPQCPFPDASLGSVINAVGFDAIYVQFYNNLCGLENDGSANDWDFGIWDYWAQNTSPNKDVKVYIGAPASSTAAGRGYVDIGNLTGIAKQMHDTFPSFGGVMLWDASQAYANSNYAAAVKSALVADGASGFTAPACSAPAFQSGTDYSGGSQVTYQGYIWQANYYASDTPSASSSSGDWNIISACSGSGTSTTSSSAASPSTTSGGSGSCAGVAAYSATAVYTTGNQVTYNGDLWTANWWTQNSVPGGSSGAWADNGACSSSKRANSRLFKRGL
ncbi:glycoside hydrolase family 18 protein [Coniophora puteana RWD-64-598 SS2]|uniref:chitinase n=1 Tax=Coniophora puteana (strain RWD-64-598) TaxID=741705 RepID=A0A5M3N4U6_CONPW|nr:glycoside hydrolase family 18 protein [Coniophora puteana RWD-64-598 SS2]EIW86439.1 glycoside hydrolase family 18 protein [Coniophora puteana RWD-64-598 SS2]